MCSCIKGEIEEINDQMIKWEFSLLNNENVIIEKVKLLKERKIHTDHMIGIQFSFETMECHKTSCKDKIYNWNVYLTIWENTKKSRKDNLAFNQRKQINNWEMNL